MKTTMQLFVREPAIQINENMNVYVVCGLIKTDKPLQDECIHIFDGYLQDYGYVDPSSLNKSTELDPYYSTEGQSLDTIMQKPWWRAFK